MNIKASGEIRRLFYAMAVTDSCFVWEFVPRQNAGPVARGKIKKPPHGPWGRITLEPTLQRVQPAVFFQNHSPHQFSRDSVFIISRMPIAVNEVKLFMIVSPHIYLNDGLRSRPGSVYALRGAGGNGLSVFTLRLSLLRLREVEPGENYRAAGKEEAGDLLMEEEPSEEGGEGRVKIDE